MYRDAKREAENVRMAVLERENRTKARMKRPVVTAAAAMVSSRRTTGRSGK
jgi:hypothetical protein